MQLRLVADEPDAVVHILDALTARQTATPDLWKALFRSEGFRRLQARQQSFGDTFSPSDFQSFVERVDLMQQRNAFRSALRRFHSVDIAMCGRRALAYLPRGSTLNASVYPVIKPQTNSFAYDLKGSPSLFLFLHPDYSRSRFSATLTHELFHVGFAQNCPPSIIKPQIDALAPHLKLFFDWMAGGFGEGFAVLAAAGGPDVDPATVAPANALTEWASSAAAFPQQMGALTSFFRRLLSADLDEQSSEEPGSALLGVQGPWYTVGWRMARTIEKAYGRAVVVDCIGDVRKLLPTYNRAVEGTRLPCWPDDVSRAFEV